MTKTSINEIPVNEIPVVKQVLSSKFPVESIKLWKHYKKLWKDVKETIWKQNNSDYFKNRLGRIVDILRKEALVKPVIDKASFELWKVFTYLQWYGTEKLLPDQLKILDRFEIWNDSFLVTEEKIDGTKWKKWLFLYKMGATWPGLMPYVVIVEKWAKVPFLNFRINEGLSPLDAKKTYIEVSNLEKEWKQKMDEIVKMIKSKKQENQI